MHPLDIPLRHLADTVDDEWESIAQLLRDHAGADFADHLTPGTGAWHMRHTVEVFRLHARSTMRALGAPADLIEAIPSDKDPIPNDMAAMRDALRADIARFSEWAVTLPPEALATRFKYGRETDFIQMLGMMTRHISWHTAAAHYWRKWRAP